MNCNAPLLRSRQSLLGLGVLGATLLAGTPDPLPLPAVQTTRLASGHVRLDWESPIPRFVVEYADRLDPSLTWRRSSATVTTEGSIHAAVLDAGTSSARFFRLRLPLTSLASTSPARGEQGVSLGRETLLHFTAPLAATAQFTVTNLHATFGGRKLLTRCELSSDRRRVSLFYLEPLPGNARVSVFLDSTDLQDELGLPVDGDGDGAPGGTALVWFDTLNLTPVSGTAVIGRVFAAHTDGSDNLPLAGVTISVDGREQDLRAVTDAEGRFQLAPVPAGRFFVHIDGRTATASRYPDGAYYPAVGKAWDAVAGVSTNLAGGSGEIFLPLIQPDTLQPASAIAPTVVGFSASVTATNPALAAARITVPPNALFSDDGSRGGRIGMAPVPPTRLPGRLPGGLELAMVFTVQTDGAGNFDQPATVCLPNDLGVVAGAPLPPGTKRSLISFDHKKGVWESVGLMTVTPDGSSLCTDPGVGIRQPGWHGAGVPPFVGPAGGDAFGGRAAGNVGDGTGVMDGTSPADGGGSGGQGTGAGTDTSPGGGVGPGGGGPGAGSSNGSGNPDSPGGGGSGPGQGGSGSDAGSDAGCRDANLVACIERGVRLRQQCQAARSAWQDQVTAACEALADRFGPNDPRVTQCYRDLGEGFKRRSRECHAIDQRMDDECAPCEHTGSSLAVEPRRLAGNPLLDDILALQAAALEAIEPYLLASQPVPPAVQAQVRAWRQQAWTAAGGDLPGFLTQQLAAIEDDLVDNFPAFLESPGNPPPHPLHYVATVARPEGLMWLRGTTGPYGAYEFFVPADGTVLIVEFLDPKTGWWGAVYPSQQTAAAASAPAVYLNPPESDPADEDADGLSDFAEFVLGTDRLNPDSDGDGVVDGTEVAQGANPLDGIAVQPGVIAAVDTPGRALDVVADDDLVVVADGPQGVALFNVADPRRPVMIAQLATPGAARGVAMSARQVAIACDRAGLAVLDLTAGLPLSLRPPLEFGSAVLAVTAAGGEALVGLESREVVRLDLFSGIQRDRLKLPGSGPVQDLLSVSGVLYVLTSSELITLSLDGDRLQVASQVAAPGQTPGSLRRKRLAAGDGLLFASHRQGFTVFDLADPLAPQQLAHHVTPQFGWKQVVPVSPSRVLAPGGANSTEGTEHHLHVYDLGPDGTNAVFVTTLPTPGAALAVAAWKGLAFVADDAAGLQIVNFQAAELSGGVPTVTLADPTLGNPLATIEGQPFRITARVSSPGLVRTVEYLIDGQRVGTAGRHPFSLELIAPVRSADRRAFTVQARAIDHGGRSATSEAWSVELLPDQTPPHVAWTVPAPGRHFGPLQWLVLGATFAERLDPSSVTTDSFRLYAAGPDGALGTADDEQVEGGTAGYRAEAGAAWRAFPTPFGAGRYRAVLTRAIRDPAGNALPADLFWEFEVFAVDLSSGGSALASGRIERPGAQDVLGFLGRAGQQLYFDEVTGTCTSGLNWRCVAPDGTVVFEEGLGGLSCGRDAGLRTLPQDGLYHLILSGPNGATNSWSVGLHDVPAPTRYPIAIGTAVFDDIPAVGAGRLETPGASDEYEFLGVAGQAVFFEEPQGDCTSAFRWLCLTPGGAVLFEESLGGRGCGRHVGWRELPDTGTYRVVVQATGDATGAYAFTLWDATPETFAITTDSLIAEGQPAPGAGHLETPGAVDQYTFTVNPGVRLSFESLSAAPALTGVRWRLEDEARAVLFDTCLGCTDPGAITLVRGGRYTLTVGGGVEAGVGTYQLRIQPAP